MKLLFHILFKTDKLSKAYHEAAHCVVAAIFTENIRLNLLTINENIAKKFHADNKGGLSISFIEVPQREDYESGDNMILISLAGICGRTIFSKGKNYTMKNFELFKKNKDLLDTRGSNGDYEITQHFSKNIERIFRIKHEYIEWSAFRWLFEYFLIVEVWYATDYIAKELLKKKDQTLNVDEIRNLILRSGLHDYLLINR